MGSAIWSMHWQWLQYCLERHLEHEERPTNRIASVRIRNFGWYTDECISLTPRIFEFWCEWPAVCLWWTLESAEASWTEACSCDEKWYAVSSLTCSTIMSLATAGCMEFKSTELLMRLTSETFWLLPDGPFFFIIGNAFGKVVWLASLTTLAGEISKPSTSSAVWWEWLCPWECPCSVYNDV